MLRVGPLTPPMPLPPSRADSSLSASASEAESGSESIGSIGGESGPEVVRQLRLQLEDEQRQKKQVTAKLTRQIKLNEQLQCQAEQEEECITNKLMKRLDELKKEKEHLARQVEMEEENITNKLSKKLEKVKQEKVTLENLLEQEQEYIVNKLQKQLSALHEEKRALEAQLRDGTDTILQTLRSHLERWRTDSSQQSSSARQPASPSINRPAASAAPAAAVPLPPSPFSPSSSGAGTSTASVAAPSLTAMTGLALGFPLEEAQGELERTHLLVSHLAAEIDALGETQERYRRECEEQQQEAGQLREELGRLQADNAGLVHRVAREREVRQAAQLETARLEQEIEFDQERQFNSCSSRSSFSVPGSPALPPSLVSGLHVSHVTCPTSPRGATPSSPLHPLLLPPGCGMSVGAPGFGCQPFGKISPRLSPRGMFSLGNPPSPGEFKGRPAPPESEADA